MNIIIVEVIDELWTSNFQYPEKRFVNMLSLVSTSIIDKLEQHISNGQQIFSLSASNSVKLRLSEAHSLVKMYLDNLK